MKSTSKAISITKYVYLAIFFALLSGFFHPLITGAPFDNVMMGVLVLFVGLGGGVLLYKALASPRVRIIYLGGGFALIAISLMFVFQLTGRV